MEAESWLVAAGGAVLLLALALKLRGPGDRDDLTGPPKRKARSLSREELDRLTDLVGRGEAAAALRQLKSAGYDDVAARRLVELTERLTGADGEARTQP